MSKKKSAGSIEEKLERLEAITTTLEDSQTSLEKSIELFEEGAKLSKECFAILKKAELKITTLKEDLDKINSDAED